MSELVFIPAVKLTPNLNLHLPPAAAGATNPYSRPATYASGTATAGAEGGAGLGYGPGNDPAGMPAAGLPGVGLAEGGGEKMGLAKAAEGVKEALGLRKT